MRASKGNEVWYIGIQDLSLTRHTLRKQKLVNASINSVLHVGSLCAISLKATAINELFGATSLLLPGVVASAAHKQTQRLA